MTKSEFNIELQKWDAEQGRSILQKIKLGLDRKNETSEVKLKDIQALVSKYSRDREFFIRSLEYQMPDLMTDASG